MIRIDAAWFAVEPLDMRAGVDTALARVVSVFGEARAHHAYLFMNRRVDQTTFSIPIVSSHHRVSMASLARQEGSAISPHRSPRRAGGA
ncbi:MAG: IS66 family insertion sequence element accessory protein TnpB, partial [Steroidobacteraceae bacterium]